jgi:TP901 family phage tail tape measure protein
MRGFATALNAGLTKNQATLKKVGTSMTRYVTLPILGVAAASVKMASDFEKSMAQIVGLTGTSRKQVAQWSDQSLEMSKTLPQGPQELADALYFVASSGVSASKAMEVVEASAKAAAAGLGETGEVANAVTSVMNAYGEETISAYEATDILVNAVRLGKAEAAEFAPVLGSLLPTASELGVQFHEVAAAVAALSRTGDTAALASTKVNAVFSALLKPAQQAEEAFQAAGTSSQQLQQDLIDKGLIQTLIDLRDSVDGNVSSLARMFPNVRALRGVLGLTGKQVEANVEVFDKLANSAGLTNEAFAAVQDEFDTRFRAALSSLQVAAIQTGRVLLPILTSITDAVAGLADGFSAMPEGMQTTIVGFGLLVAAIGPAIKAALFLHKNLKLLFATLTSPWGIVITGLVLGLVKLSAEMGRAETAAAALEGAMENLEATVQSLVTDGNVANFGKEIQKNLDAIERSAQKAAPLWQRVVATAWSKDLSHMGRLVADTEEGVRLRTRAMHDVAVEVASAFRSGTLTFEETSKFMAEIGFSAAETDRRLEHLLSTTVDLGEGGLKAIIAYYDEQGKLAGGLNQTLVDLITNQLRLNAITSGEAVDALVSIGVEYGVAKRAVGEFTKAQKQSASATKGMSRAINIFTFNSQQAFDEWVKEAKSNFDDWIGEQQKFKEAFKLTTRQFVKTMEERARIARQAVKDMRALDRAQVPEDFKRWLIEQGPEYIHAFVEGSKTEQGKLVKAWGGVDQAAKDYGKSLDELPGKVSTKIDADTEPARTAINDLVNDLTELGFSVTGGGGPLELDLGQAASRHFGGIADKSGMVPIGKLKADELMAVLQRGEYVVRRDVVQRPGMLDLLKGINAGVLDDYHSGGLLDSMQQLNTAYRNPPTLSARVVARLLSAQELIAKLGVAGSDPRMSPNAARAQAFLRAAFPGISANPGIMVRGYNFAPGPPFSQHSYGNALDITPASLGPAVSALLRMNARLLSVANLIWNRMSSYAGGPWRGYSGSNPHTDHVHADFIPPGVGMPPPGGGWIGARGGYRGRLSSDTFIAAHAGEDVSIAPRGKRERLMLDGPVVLQVGDRKFDAYIRGAARREVAATEDHRARKTRAKR